MEHIKIITIGRQYGSGGRIIGKRIAEELGFDFYDKALIDKISEECGYKKEYVEQVSENLKGQKTPIGNVMHNYYGTSPMVDFFQIATEDIFFTQARTIKQIANEGSCVIVGRCADYILRERNDTLNIFIHGKFQDRVKRAVNEYGVESEKAVNITKKINREREKHYTYYCDRRWGMAENYHMSLSTSKFSEDECVKIIVDRVRNI